MKKNKSYIKPIVVGFAALYLFSMSLSTYLLKVKFENDYSNHLYVLSSVLNDSFADRSDGVRAYSKSRQAFTLYATQVLSGLTGIDKYQQVSAALYDQNGTKVAQTCNAFGSYGKASARRMEDFFTEEDMEKVMSYMGTPVGVSHNGSAVFSGLEYSVDSYFYDGLEGPGMMSVTKMTQVTENSYAGSGFSWKWVHPSLLKNSEKHPDIAGARAWQDYEDCQPGVFYLPCYVYGKEAWERWQKDEYLQNFPSSYEMTVALSEYNDKYAEAAQNPNEKTITIGYTQEPFLISSGCPVTVILRQTTHPWLAAMDYMKYVYLIGFALALACMIKVLFSTKKAQEKQEALEQTRRDFTNAIAHELKTPLGVVRAFAENIKENTVEEKRDYYLDQIIAQTESMDNMVKEMIAISKLDSQELNRTKEKISLMNLAKEEAEKFQALIQEKKLKLIFEENGVFSLDGDSWYLKKAIWNLLDNAVEYSDPGGSIWIFADENHFTVENAGENIAEEHLPHLGEMFYTGKESRTRKNNHMGLGLYLVKKIAEVHGLKLEIQNTDVGVKASIMR